MLWKGLFLEAEKGTGGPGSENGNSDKAGGEQTQPLAYDAWVKDQPEEIKTMLAGWESGLKNALQSERKTRQDLEKQVREMAGKADKGSQAQTELTQLADKIAEADRRADFFEAAHAAGAKNLKLAFLVATTDDLFDRRGQVNFETMKAQYPELFEGGAKPPRGDAGAGANSQPSGHSMNDFIRTAAGRK